MTPMYIAVGIRLVSYIPANLAAMLYNHLREEEKQ